MKYLTFIRSSENTNRAPPPALMAAMGRFIERRKRDGTLVDTGGLLPSKDGLRLRVDGGRLSITDGPFTEAKEIIGGWAVLQGTRDQVVEVATEFVELHRRHWPEFDFECEVRPMFEPDMGG